MAKRKQDSELLMETASGNDRAFSVLVNHYKGALKSFIRRKIGDETLAEDLCQESLIKIYSSIRSGAYREYGMFRSYALRVAMNVVVDYVRRDKGMEDSFSELADGAVVRMCEIEEKSAEEELIDRQNIAMVRGMVRSLPKDQKRVILMRFYEGCSFNEIAERTGVSIGTALGRVHYAIKNMRKMMRMEGLALAG